MQGLVELIFSPLPSWLTALFLHTCGLDSLTIIVRSESTNDLFEFPLFLKVVSFLSAVLPYSVCDPESPTYGASQNYTNIRFAKETDAIPPLSITVLQDTYVRYCQQRFSGFDGFLFPPVPSKQPKGLTWMNESQESLTLLYGWTSCFFLIGFIVLFFGNAIKNYVKSWVMGVCKYNVHFVRTRRFAHS